MGIDRHPKTRYFPIQDGKVLVSRTTDGTELLRELPRELDAKIIYRRNISLRRGEDHVVVELNGAVPPDNIDFIDLRSLLGRISDQEWLDAGRALQILRWRRDHRFCSRCGQPISESSGEIAMHCASCSFTIYPRLSPAVIMSIIDGDRILLGRSSRFAHKMYSVLAGYMEPGETMEQAVAREIEEEVGVRVDRIRYRGSQPWPFPHSLMVAFSTRYVEGILRVNNDELEDARWFTRENMPDKLPIKGSIARRLIEDFVAGVNP